LLVNPPYFISSKENLTPLNQSFKRDDPVGKLENLEIDLHKISSAWVGRFPSMERRG